MQDSYQPLSDLTSGLRCEALRPLDPGLAGRLRRLLLSQSPSEIASAIAKEDARLLLCPGPVPAEGLGLLLLQPGSSRRKDLLRRSQLLSLFAVSLILSSETSQEAASLLTAWIRVAGCLRRLDAFAFAAVMGAVGKEHESYQPLSDLTSGLRWEALRQLDPGLAGRLRSLLLSQSPSQANLDSYSYCIGYLLAALAPPAPEVLHRFKSDVDIHHRHFLLPTLAVALILSSETSKEASSLLTAWIRVAGCLRRQDSFVFSAVMAAVAKEHVSSAWSSVPSADKAEYEQGLSALEQGEDGDASVPLLQPLLRLLLDANPGTMEIEELWSVLERARDWTLKGPVYGRRLRDLEGRTAPAPLLDIARTEFQEQFLCGKVSGTPPKDLTEKLESIFVLLTAKNGSA